MNPTLRRLERVLALVPWLLAHPGARIADVAERFDASPEEIADDLDVLGYCGVPGYGGGDLVEVSVVGDRVHVRMADFFRRPLRLDRREAVTLLLAGRALLATPDLGDADALRRAVGRLEQALGAAEVAVDLGAPDRDLLARLRAAVADRRVIDLRYRATGDERETSRLVEPWAVVAAGGAWYLRGHCRRTGGPRDFRLDRVREAVVTAEVAPPPPADALATAPGYTSRPSDHEVLLEVEPAAAWLAEAVPGATVPSPGTLRLRARSLEWAARLVLSMAGTARALEPPELADRVRELATAARAHYTEPVE